MNTLGLKIQEENRKSVDFESKLIDIKQHKFKIQLSRCK